MYFFIFFKIGMFLGSSVYMNRKKNRVLVPEQNAGNKLNVEHSVITSSIKEAITLFSNSVKRLMDVNNWQQLAGSALSHFQVTDKDGQQVNREPKESDLFKITVPGPMTAEKFDWVRVEMIKAKVNRVAIKVRPVASPLHPKAGTAHFFKDIATSTFQVFRRGRIVTAAVYGRNEVPHINSPDLTDSIRNAAVAIGAIAGASRMQWESLVYGILDQKKEEGTLI